MSEAVAELRERVRVTGVVAELGVADALAGGPRPVAEVADDVGADRDVLERFLHALASGGVFAEVEPGVWRNTESSALLGREMPWGAFAQLYGGIWHRAAGRLDAGGRPAFDGDFWTWLAEHPHERALFDLAADVYVLGTVLHNWPDEQAAAILRAICADAPPGARVLILDLVIRQDDDSPGVAWFGLLGLALFGAHERTEREWRTLLDAAGLRVDSVHEALIEARCP